MRSFARGAFFVSGVAGLVFEVVWVRRLGLTLGTTTLAVATATAATMGGLALGGLLGGRVADGLRRPLLAYGAAEMAVGGLGLLVPAVCALLPAWEAWAAPSGAAAGSLGLLRFGLAGAVLLLPTVAMGTTLPILARGVTQGAGGGAAAAEVGVLYALNTLGALVGAAASGLWWIPAWGLQTTNALAVALDVGLGAGAVAVGLCLPATPPAPVAPATPPGAPRGGSVAAVLGLSGAAAMALQVLWTRALGTALGPSTYAFSATVCAYLAGLSLGAGLAARLVARLRRRRLALTVALLSTGAFALVGLAQVDRLPGLLRRVVVDPHLTMAALVRADFVLAALSIVPATLGMGAIFALSVALLVEGPAPTGAAVGRAYAANATGAIVGCFAAPFVLLPLFGVEGGMRVAALAYGAAALVLAAGAADTAATATRWVAVGGSAALAAALALWPRWDIQAWTAGAYRVSSSRADAAAGGDVGAALIFHEDGLASTVTVEEHSDVRWIKVNGKIDGSSAGDMPTQVLSGMLPLLLRPDARRVAVIGCGSGVSVGTVLRGDAAEVTLVELDRAVVRAAHLFDAVNHAPWTDPRLRIVEDDGRSYLMRQTVPLDVIVSEPSNPWMAGASALFTAEFFELARQRLRDDGLFVQWLQAYELAPERIASVLKTFHTTFEHTLVFAAHPDANDLLLVGSRQPQRLTLPALTAGFARHADELARAELRRPAELLALLLVDERALETLDAAVPLNTDDNALIEFGAPADLVRFAEDDPALPPALQAAGERFRAVGRLLPEPQAWPTTLAELADGYLRQGMLDDAVGAARALAEPSLGAAAETVAVAAEAATTAALLAAPEDRERLADLTAAATQPDYREALRLTADGDEAAALTFLEQRPSLVRTSGHRLLLYGVLLSRQAQFAAARQALRRAQALPDAAALRPAIAYYLARNAYREGDYRLAVHEMLQYRAGAAQTSEMKAEPL